MSDKRPVVVYGVSGYTGRLVCEYLREYNVPFIAAGRDKAKVQAVVEKIPGIETADYEVVGVEHNVEADSSAFLFLLPLSSSFTLSLFLSSVSSS